MRKKVFRVVICALLLALGDPAEAQQAKSVRKIGYVSRDLHPADSRASSDTRLAALREGLRQLGFIEGKNIIIEYRYADERLERLAALAEELVRLKVDIIVTDTTVTARAARKVTTTIPIVFLSGSDPTVSGGAASLARPGGNVTGFTNFSGELRAKRLELLKEVLPKVARFALLEGSGGTASKDRNIEDAQIAAKALGVKLQVLEVNEQNPDFDNVFRVMAKERIGGLVVGTGSILTLTLSRRKILGLTEQARIPAIYSTENFIEDGGLMFYGVDRLDLARRGATYVDKILKGEKPADPPIQRPMKFDFVVSLIAANKIGLTIPPNVLVRANPVIR